LRPNQKSPYLEPDFKKIHHSMKKLILPGILFSTLSAGAQLYIDNATFFIDNGAVVTVQGDVFSNINIQAAGTGKLRMGGTTAQNINMNGFTVPNLQIDNASANVVMTGAAKVTGALEFTNGKVQLGNFDLTLGSAGSHTGAGVGKFAETNGTGVFKKEVTAAGNTTLPIGTGTTYTPLQYQLTAGTYNAGAFVAARSVAGTHPNKHPRSSDYLNSYWKLSSGNITGGTKVAVGTYVDPTSVTGLEADIRAMYWNGTTWVIGTAQDAATNTVTAPVPTATQDLYAMNKFLLASPKVFLQGAYNSNFGLMNDLLRNSSGANGAVAGTYTPGVLPASNVVPTSDPYRTPTYSTSFTHVANATAETISTDILKDLANPNDQIVDWVFLELRTNALPSTVTQTRAALVQRDGDVVDVDGVSPIYFKNLDPNTYNVSVKHRNHLGVRTATGTSLNLTTPLTKINFSAAAANNLSNFTADLGGGVFGLWAANANKNLNIRVAGPDANASDFIYIKTTLGAAPLLSNQYSESDVNMNRVVRVAGPNSATSDFIFLKEVLGSSPIKTQPAH
jgi:hypothetical protein